MQRPYDPETNSLLIGHDIFNHPVWQKFTLYSGSGHTAQPLSGNFALITDPSPFFTARFDNSLTDPHAIAANRANATYDVMLELGLVEPLSHLRQLLDHTAIMEYQKRNFPVEQLHAEAKVVHEAYERVFGEGVAPVEVLVKAKKEMMEMGVVEIGETETLKKWLANREFEGKSTQEKEEQMDIPSPSDIEKETHHEEKGSNLGQLSQGGNRSERR